MHNKLQKTSRSDLRFFNLQSLLPWPGKVPRSARQATHHAKRTWGWAWRGRAKPENLFHWSSCVRHDLSLALELRVRGKLSTARRLDPKASLTSLHLSLYPGGEVAGGSPRSNQPPAIQQLVPSCGQSITTSFGKARGGTLASRHHMNHNS